MSESIIVALITGGLAAIVGSELRPGLTAKKIGVAKRGEKIRFGGLTADNGWHLVVYDNQNGWVSGKFGRLEV